VGALIVSGYIRGLGSTKFVTNGYRASAYLTGESLGRRLTPGWYINRIFKSGARGTLRWLLNRSQNSPAGGSEGVDTRRSRETRSEAIGGGKEIRVQTLTPRGGKLQPVLYRNSKRAPAGRPWRGIIRKIRRAGQ